MLMPSSAAQSAAGPSFHSPWPALGTQQTMSSPDDVVVGHGSGKQEPAPMFVPPSAAQSSALSSLQSSSPLSGTQHWMSPAVVSSGISVSMSSSPWSSLTSIS